MKDRIERNKESISILVLWVDLIALTWVASLVFGESMGNVAKFVAFSGITGLIIALQLGRSRAKNKGEGHRNGMLSDILNWMSITLIVFCIGIIGTFFFERNSPFYNSIAVSFGYCAFVTITKILHYAYKVIGSRDSTQSE